MLGHLKFLKDNLIDFLSSDQWKDQETFHCIEANNDDDDDNDNDDDDNDDDNDDNEDKTQMNEKFIPTPAAHRP